MIIIAVSLVSVRDLCTMKYTIKSFACFYHVESEAMWHPMKSLNGSSIHVTTKPLSRQS